MAWVVDTLKYGNETPTLPDALTDATPQQLAEARSRLAQIAQIATALRKLVDCELVEHLQGGAMRYGDQILRPSTRGRPKVVDRGLWWDMVTEAVLKTDDPSGLLAALYPADSLRLTALTGLAEVLNLPVESVKATMIEYDPPTSPLDVTPIEKAPRWAHALSEGQVSTVKVGG